MRVFTCFLMFVGYLIFPATSAQRQSDLHIEELWQYGQGVIDNFAWQEQNIIFAARGTVWQFNPQSDQTFTKSTRKLVPISTSPDGTCFITYDSGNFSLWNVQTQSVISTFRREGDIDDDSVAWHPDSPLVATGGYDAASSPNRPYQVELRDTTTGELTAVISGYPDLIVGLSWHPDGEMLAVRQRSGVITIENTVNGERITELTADSINAATIGWSPDGSKLAATSDGDSSVKLWRTETFELISTPNQPVFILSLAWSGDSTRLAGSLLDSGVGVWNIERDELLVLGVEPEVMIDGDIEHIGWRGDLLAGLDRTHRLRVWNVDEAALVWDSTEHQFHSEVESLAVSRDGTFAALGYRNSQKIDIIDTGNGTLIQTLMLSQPLDISEMAWSPANDRLAVGSDSLFIWQFDPKSMARFAQVDDLVSPEFSWSPDGILAVVTRPPVEERLLLIDGETGEVLPTTRDLPGLYKTFWSPDGRYVALYRFNRLTGDEVDPILKQIDILDVQHKLMTTIQFPSLNEGVIVPLEELVWLPDSSGLMGYINLGQLWRWHVGDEQAEILTPRPAMDTTNQSFWLSIDTSGDLLAVSNPTTEGKIHILDAKSGELLLSLDDLIDGTRFFNWGGDDLLVVYDGVLRAFHIR